MMSSCWTVLARTMRIHAVSIIVHLSFIDQRNFWLFALGAYPFFEKLLIYLEHR